MYHSQDVFEPKTVEVKGITKGTDRWNALEVSQTKQY